MRFRTQKGASNPVMSPAAAPLRSTKPRTTGERRPEWQLTAGLNRRREQSHEHVPGSFKDIRNGAVHVGWRGPRFLLRKVSRFQSFRVSEFQGFNVRDIGNFDNLKL